MTDQWHDRTKQPRCNICGRFARWDENRKRWTLSCVWWNCDEGTWEHE